MEAVRGRKSLAAPLFCESVVYIRLAKKMRIVYWVIIATILLAEKSFSNQKIVIYSWRYGTDREQIIKHEPEVAAQMDYATIVTNENDISHILKVMKEVHKAPAQLCGYDWVFLHFENDEIIGRHTLNVSCRKEIIGDQLTPYLPSDSSNASIFTMEVDCRFDLGEITKEIDTKKQVVINPNREFTRFPKIKIEYAIFKKFKKVRKPPIPRIPFFFRSIADNFYFNKYLRKNIKKLKHDFPELVSINDGHSHNRGRMQLILPIETDSTVMQRYSLPVEFKPEFSKPETYNLFLIVDKTKNDSLNKLLKIEGIKDIIKKYSS